MNSGLTEVIIPLRLVEQMMSMEIDQGCSLCIFGRQFIVLTREGADALKIPRAPVK